MSDTWVSTLYSMALSGKADESVWDGSMITYGFRLNNKIAEMTGYKESDKYVCLWKSGKTVQYDVLSYGELMACEGGTVDDDEEPTRDWLPPVDEYDEIGEAGY